jgi:hypothetical protein
MHQKRREILMPVFMITGVFLFFGTNLFTWLVAKAAIADHAVLNEVAIDSVIGTGGTEDDWVELFNPTESDIDLSGWSIQKTSGSGSGLNKQALSGILPAKGYFLIVRNGASTSPDLIAKADYLATDSFSLASNNIIYLVNDNTNISTSTDQNIVDMVGYGTALFHEGSAAAPSIAETKTISRDPDGEDTNENSIDFKVLSVPTPQNSKQEAQNDISGTVGLTIVPDEQPVQNISAQSADIVFYLNSDGTAKVRFGPSSNYGSTTAEKSITANEPATIELAGLKCSSVYHFSIIADNPAKTSSDATSDATFTTLPCGINVNSLNMTKGIAKADDSFENGWKWELTGSIYNMNETNVKMKFSQWSGPSTIPAAGNIRFSADSGATWISIGADNAYSLQAADIKNIDLSTASGRQFKIIIEMKVPKNTLAGDYSANYGILAN